MRALPPSLSLSLLPSCFSPCAVPPRRPHPHLSPEGTDRALRDFHNGIPSFRPSVPPSAPNCNLLVAPRAAAPSRIDRGAASRRAAAAAAGRCSLARVKTENIASFSPVVRPSVVMDRSLNTLMMMTTTIWQARQAQRRRRRPSPSSSSSSAERATGDTAIVKRPRK